MSGFEERSMAATQRLLDAELNRRPRIVIDDGTREFLIPCRAPNLNDLIRAHGRSRFAYDALKKKWADMVALVVRPLCIVSLRGVPVSVHLEFVEPNQRRDPDNLCGAASKLILDGLVKAGVLDGDGWKHITGLSFSWRVGNPAGVRVVLTPREG